MRRRYGTVVWLAPAAVWAAFIGLAMATIGGPTAYTWRDVVSNVVFTGALLLPSAVAVWLLWRAWWRRYGAAVSTMDAPEQLLAAAVATVPEDRRDWGAAMTAELAQVSERGARWRFALGCARAALVTPRAGRMPVLLVLGLSVAAVVVLALVALPAMRVFAATFAGLVGVLAVLAMARSRRVGRPVSGLPLALAGVIGVAAAVAITGYMLATYPSAAEALGPGEAVALAVLLAGCVWLTLAPPRVLSSSRLARGTGLVLGLVLAGGVLLAARLPDSPGVIPLLFPFPMVSFFVVSAVIAAVAGSMRAGAEAAVWTGLVGALFMYGIWQIEAIRWSQMHAGLLLDADPGPVGVNLTDGLFVALVFLPLWGVPFGVIGAALGGKVRGRA